MTTATTTPETPADATARQLALPWPRRGGARPGAGRKPTPGRRPLTPHTSRPRITRHQCAHVTLRLAAGLPGLREPGAVALVRTALVAARGRHGMNVTDYSIQRDHLHLVVEALDPTALSRGMQGLCVRFARGLNRLWERRGAVFGDRFHARVLRSPRELRNVLVYVLGNARKHAAAAGRRLPAAWIDPCSSAPAFEGWRTGPARVKASLLGCADPQSWLRRIGWLRHGGPLDPTAAPGP